MASITTQQGTFTDQRTQLPRKFTSLSTTYVWTLMFTKVVFTKWKTEEIQSYRYLQTWTDLILAQTNERYYSNVTNTTRSRPINVAGLIFKKPKPRSQLVGAEKTMPSSVYPEGRRTHGNWVNYGSRALAKCYRSLTDPLSVAQCEFDHVVRPKTLSA